MPAVVLVHEPFANLARAQCQSVGAESPSIIVYRQDAPALESDAASDDKARGVAAQVLEVLSARQRLAGL